MEETIPFKNLHSREFQGHKKKVHSVAWNCYGTKLASGSVDQTARVWHIEPQGHGKIKDIELKGHTDSVDQLCWDPKHADLIATASGDKTVRQWDARSGKCSQQAELSGENINITYKPDGTYIAVGNRDDELTILDVRKFKAIHKRKFNYEVNEIAWNMTGDMFFLTTGNGTVEVLAYPSLRPLDILMAHTAGCYCIAIDPIGRYFAVGSADSLVSLWDISQMLCVRTFTKLEWPVRTKNFNHTGEYIASASEDLFIDIASMHVAYTDWHLHVETGRTVHQIPCRAAMNSVKWNPKYNLLAYAGDDKNTYQADEGRLMAGLISECRNWSSNQSIASTHGAVLALTACVLSAPYDMPSWLPEHVTLLARFVGEASPVKSTVTKAVAGFRRTHADTWNIQKDSFTEEQLEVLADTSSSSSYFA